MRMTDGLELKDIMGTYTILPADGKLKSTKGLVTLNELGIRLWELLQKDMEFEELVSEVVNEYEVDEDTVREDIQEWLDRFDEYKLIDREDAR